MEWIVNISNIRKNIEKAISLSNVPIALMFKEFYKDLWYHIDTNGIRCFGLSLPKSICYSLGKASKINNGSFVVNKKNALDAISCGLQTFYIPINANDNREGLSIDMAVSLAKFIKEHCNKALIMGAITSGCMNDKYPHKKALRFIDAETNMVMDGLSIGGSFWLGKSVPEFVSELRIGEYMLFGTIPFYKGENVGWNGIEIETSVIATYPERKQILIDAGYYHADMMECRLVNDKSEIVGCSSEYTILSVQKEYRVGNKIRFIPNYKSLVKMCNGKVRYE